MNIEVKRNVLILWDFLCLKNKPEKAECIIGLGSILESVPRKCALLYKRGYGKYIIFTGNCGKGTEGVITKTEAEIFKEKAIQEGVPEDKILIEEAATNTYENFRYSLKVLEENNLHPESYLIVGKPYQERRAEDIAWVELKDNFSVAPFSVGFEEFLEYVTSNGLMNMEDVINEIVAEINICLLAPKYGIQQECDIPNDVKASYEFLCNVGYTKYLLTEDKIARVIEKWRQQEILNNGRK